jgi:hypothetical protein
MAFAFCAKKKAAAAAAVVQSHTYKLICVSHFCEHVVSKETIFSSLNINVQEQTVHPCVTMYTEKQFTQIFI